jgi:hypothetical protein
MRIIITENQNKILWLRRRLDDPEINNLLRDIVIEGFDYIDACNYKTYPGYELEVVNGSIPTFINSYIELYGEVSVEDSELEKFVGKIIVSKYRPIILREYRDRYCDDETDF